MNQKRLRSKSESDVTDAGSLISNINIEFNVDVETKISESLAIVSNEKIGESILLPDKIDIKELTHELMPDITSEYEGADGSLSEEYIDYSSDDSFSYEKKLDVKVNHDLKNHQCLVVRQKLREWAMKFTVLQTILTALLLILQGVFP